MSSNPVQLTDTDGGHVLVTGANALSVDGSAVTQPVSGSVSITGPISGTVAVTNTYLSNQVGTWNYYAGASGTVVVTAGQKVLGIAAHATTAGSMTINGGSSVPLPVNSQVNISPVGNLVAPTIVFTGTDSYFVEVTS